MGSQIRRVYICEHKGCVPPRRIFLMPGDPIKPPRCPEHGATMKLQANKPYPQR